MPGLPKLSLVEGAFEELAIELAQYLDSVKGDESAVLDEISPLLAEAENASRPKETDKDAVLKKLVTASSVLNNAPERELQAAYNLLIHLISQAPDPDTYLPRVCKYLSSPITSSPHNGTGIALGILATLFNTIQPDDETRYHVLLAIIEVVKTSGNYGTLQPQLSDIENWVTEWELDPEEAQTLFTAIADAAQAASEPEQSYLYLLKGLRHVQKDPTAKTTRELSIRALRLAVQNEKHFDFQDLIALDSIQALRKSDPAWSELLDLVTSENYDDFLDFKETNGEFLTENGLDSEGSAASLDTKMRLLTLASLAAQAAAHTRTLPYAQIAHSLAIPAADVESWVIDSIRSGLVEGKLSQARGEFLIHRSTYRVFGDNQWREVASRLETWRASLVNVLAVIRAQKEEFAKEKEAELNGQVSGGGPSHQRDGQGFNRGDRRQRNAPPPQAVEVE